MRAVQGVVSMFEGLERNHYQAVLADPPWPFRTWSMRGRGRAPDRYYQSTMTMAEIKALPVGELAARDAALFLWVTSPTLIAALDVITAWGFTYKTVGFVWMKQTKRGTPHIGCGYWTRANGEMCLLATRGKPKRLHADIPQAILEPRRENSRKPDCVHGRIERLVAGPYLELFARQRRVGWDCIGDEVDKFSEAPNDHYSVTARSTDQAVEEDQVGAVAEGG